MKRIKSIIYISLLLAIAMLSAYLTWQCSASEDSNGEIEIENTPIVIEAVLPKGELYLCTAIIEDYVQIHRKERRLGIFSKKHTCVQIMKQKCSYKIDLDDVEYTHVGDMKVLVKLPEIKYIATTQDTPFMSDDEEFWIEVMPNTNALKRKVEKKIQTRFDTKENRTKARRQAEENVAHLLKELGYECEFASSIQNDNRHK